MNWRLYPLELETYSPVNPRPYHEPEKCHEFEIKLLNEWETYSPHEYDHEFEADSCINPRKTPHIDMKIPAYESETYP
ncbi:hypothetical protein QJS04_geneDACA022663 [Acorus gramineus]|uniref:Uncharacterized protein n=1 Tax=Acorus gramineus TaxID=55184 RepID=A0AAV9B546_ACOGR|nr:hypothetical protein QJS04_geneDACA022663 [Acorus gramineus]